MSAASESALLELPPLPGLQRLRSGKVREVFALHDPAQLLIVATDRISAYDCVLPNGIPGKGQLLTQMSVFWFEKLASIVPNHLISVDLSGLADTLGDHRGLLEGRAMIVEKTEPVRLECVVRGYLAGSGWVEYQRAATLGGESMPDGLREAERLPEPVFTPTTKPEHGKDEPVSWAEAVEITGGMETATFLRDRSLQLYAAAHEYALHRGVIIADTKFEFGRRADGKLILIDEALTPDSSRFWPVGEYEPGRAQPSFDKQFVRDFLSSSGWNRQPPAPDLPAEVVCHTRAKYQEAWRRLSE